MKTKVQIYASLYEKTRKLQEREIELIRTKELLKSEKKLKTIIEALSEGVIVADKSGKISQMNTEAKRIWGEAKFVAIEEFGLYQGWWLDSGRKLEAHDWAMARSLLHGETIRHEKIKILSFDEKEKVILNSASPLWGENNEIVGAVAVIEDITEHVRIERGLRADRLETSI